MPTDSQLADPEMPIKFNPRIQFSKDQKTRKIITIRGYHSPDEGLYRKPLYYHVIRKISINAVIIGISQYKKWGGEDYIGLAFVRRRKDLNGKPALPSWHNIASFAEAKPPYRVNLFLAQSEKV